MKLLIRLTYIFLILTAFKAHGQDPQFTQFYSNPLYQSPSLTGAISGYRAALNYRDQWPKMPGKLTTVSFALDYNMSRFNSGLGVYLMRDMAGSAAFNNLTGGLLYSYNIKINRKVYFRPGIGVYYVFKTIDPTKLSFSSELEIEDGLSPILEGEIIPKSQAIDGTLSGLLIMSNFWVGFTADHLMQPNFSFTDVPSKTPIKYTGFVGYRFYKLERLIGTKRQSITVTANYRHQGLADQLDLGVYWSYDPFTVGLWYRDLPFVKDLSRRDAIAVLLGYKYKELSLGYSYDITISNLISTTGGAHELSVIFNFDIKQKRKFKPIPCPKF